MSRDPLPSNSTIFSELDGQTTSAVPPTLPVAVHSKFWHGSNGNSLASGPQHLALHGDADAAGDGDTLHSSEQHSGMQEAAGNEHASDQFSTAETNDQKPPMHLDGLAANDLGALPQGASRLSNASKAALGEALLQEGSQPPPNKGATQSASLETIQSTPLLIPQTAIGQQDQQSNAISTVTRAQPSRSDTSSALVNLTQEVEALRTAINAESASPHHNATKQRAAPPPSKAEFKCPNIRMPEYDGGENVPGPRDFDAMLDCYWHTILNETYTLDEEVARQRQVKPTAASLGLQVGVGAD